MAHYKIGGWFFKGKVFAQLKLANQFWGFSRKHNDGGREVQTSLIFIGFYNRGAGDDTKLFAVHFFWLSFQFGVDPR